MGLNPEQSEQSQFRSKETIRCDREDSDGVWEGREVKILSDTCGGRILRSAKSHIAPDKVNLNV